MSSRGNTDMKDAKRGESIFKTQQKEESTRGQDPEAQTLKQYHTDK